MFDITGRNSQNAVIGEGSVKKWIARRVRSQNEKWETWRYVVGEE